MGKEKINKEILENIKNPIVKKALQRRCADFVFNYGDVHHDGVSTTSEREREKYQNRKRGEGRRDEKGKYSEYNEGFWYKEQYNEGGHDDYFDVAV